MEKRSRRIEELPLDLIDCQILIRLPVKNLCRFKCVSKPWRSLISDPQFQEHHRRHAEQSPLLLVAEAEPNTKLVRFSTHSQPSFQLQKRFCITVPTTKFDLIQSCRGLLCFRTLIHGSILLCNPVTEEIITLPPRPRQEFDICIGFGYAASTGRFKVVRFFTPGPYDDENLSEVFTVGTTEGWREARSPPPYMPRFGEHLPFLHGALHLLPDDFQVQDGHYIAAFDVETEEYRVIALPGVYFREARPWAHSSRLEELRGSLCLAFDFGDPCKMLQLWFLKDYHGGKWEKQYTIDLSTTFFCIRASPLAIADDGLILLYLKFMTKEDELCCYNTKENQFAGVMGVNSMAAYYVESFLSLGSR